MASPKPLRLSLPGREGVKPLATRGTSFRVDASMATIEFAFGPGGPVAGGEPVGVPVDRTACGDFPPPFESTTTSATIAATTATTRATSGARRRLALTGDGGCGDASA